MNTIASRVLAVALPAAVFFGGSRLLGRLAGAGRMARYRSGGERPLNVRLRGYDADDVARVWRLLDAPAPGGTGRYLDMERRFLQFDLLFPVFYGAAMLAGLWLAWHGRPRGDLPAWPALLVALDVAADWTENTLQLRELARFDAGQPLARGTIAVASLATQVKLVAFTTVFLVILWFL